MHKIFIVLLFFSTLYGNWNSDYRATSMEIYKKIDQINHSNYNYKINRFQKHIASLLQNNKPIVSKIEKMKKNEKMVFVNRREGWVVKKREFDVIHDVYAYELSILFDLSQYVIPAYPYKIGNNLVVLQDYKRFLPGKSFRPRQNFASAISLENYWRANILSYLLGFSDLSGRNVGFAYPGRLIFFDTERLFHFNIPCSTSQRYKIPFRNTSFSWPQCHKALNRGEALSLNSFLQKIKSKKEAVRSYCQARELDKEAPAIIKNIEQLAKFEAKEGQTFYDLYMHLYPQFLTSVEDIKSLVQKVTQKKATYAQIFNFLKNRPKILNEKNKNQFQGWVRKNLPLKSEVLK